MEWSADLGAIQEKAEVQLTHVTIIVAEGVCVLQKESGTAVMQLLRSHIVILLLSLTDTVQISHERRDKMLCALACMQRDLSKHYARSITYLLQQQVLQHTALRHQTEKVEVAAEEHVQPHLLRTRVRNESGAQQSASFSQRSRAQAVPRFPKTILTSMWLPSLST